MCTASMIYDYGRERIPDNQWTRPLWGEFQELIKKAEEFDIAAKQPDCEDPEKSAWAKTIEERLARLEGGSPEPATASPQPDWEIG